MINVPDHILINNNGPEFQFTLLSTTKSNVTGLDGSQGWNFNTTNSLTCRPEKENSLKCFLKGVQMTGFTEKTNVTETLDRSLFEPFYFEIKFVEGGVDKITFEEAIKNDSREKLVRTVANLMRFGMKAGEDGSLIRVERKKDNFLSGVCESRYLSGFIYSERLQNLSSWNLDLAPVYEKLDGKDLYAARRWILTDCNPKIEPLIWAGFIYVDAYKDDELKVVSDFFTHKICLLF